MFAAENEMDPLKFVGCKYAKMHIIFVCITKKCSVFDKVCQPYK